jgi:4-diphosphocytidyl-2-C-methyl-D-erythritol kinase
VTRRDVPAAWAEAPAKVNLGLVVTGRRADGFHTLDSVFLRLALHDHLEARPAADPDGPDQVTVTGDPSVPTRENIVLRAVAAMRQAAGIPLPALQLHLDKHIPAAAGLGGGSSDAAASLRLAAEVWGLVAATPPTDLLASLGADVPFFASGQAAARGRGIGEALDALPAPEPPPGILLVTPRDRLSTAAVFAALRGFRGETRDDDQRDRVARIDELVRALRAGVSGAELASLAAHLRDANDLWEPATRLQPGLPALREALEAHLERAVLLSGSGPTLVALYPSPEAGARAATSLEAAGTAELGTATIIATSTSRGGTA